MSYINLLVGKKRPSTAGRDWQLCGDKYGGMNVGNVLLIQMVLSFLYCFGVLTPLKATKIKGHSFKY